MISKNYLIFYSILIFFCLCSLAQAEIIPYLPSPQLGGLNTSDSPLILDPRYLITANNVLYDHIGSRLKRGGMIHLNESSLTESSGSNSVMGVFEFSQISQAGAETNKLLCHADGKIYKIDNFDGVMDEISSGPLTIDKQAGYAVLRQVNTTVDTVVMVNGAEIPKTWNQSESCVNDLAGYPSGVAFYPSFIVAHKNRLFAGGVPGYPYRLYYSAAYKYNDWNTASDAGYMDIIDIFGSKLTGAASFMGYLVIFTENSVHYLSGSTITDFVLTPFLTGIGAVNQASIINKGNDLYFPSRKGIHSLTATEKYGSLTETYLSSPIQAEFNSLRMDKLENMCGEIWAPKNYIIWSATQNGNSKNNICFVYDYLGNRWSTWTNINAASFGIGTDTEGNEVLLSGNYDGFINKMNRDDCNDNGAAIEMTWTTPYLSLGDPLISKSFNELFFYLKPQGNNNFTISYRVDNSSSETLTFSQAGEGGTFGTFLFDVDQFGGGTLLPRSQSLTGVGKTVQITCEQNDLNVGHESYGFAIEAIPTQVDYSK